MLAAAGGFLYHAAGNSTAMTGGDMFALGVICGVMVGVMLGMLISIASSPKEGGGGWWKRRRDERPRHPGPSGGGGEQPKDERHWVSDVEDFLRDAARRPLAGVGVERGRPSSPASLLRPRSEDG